MKDLVFFMRKVNFVDDDVYDFVMAHYVSWGWYGAHIGITFDFDNKCKEFLNRVTDPSAVSNKFSQLIAFSRLCDTNSINNKIIVRNFDLK